MNNPQVLGETVHHQLVEACLESELQYHVNLYLSKQSGNRNDPEEYEGDTTTLF